MKYKETLNISDNEALEKIENASQINPSKIFNRWESIQMGAEIKSFSHMLSKSGKSHIIAPEMKNIVDDFERNNFDLQRTDKKYFGEFKRVYDELSFAMNENPDYFKQNDKAAKLYCDIYETLSTDKFKKLAAKAKSKKGVKGLENFTSVEELNSYITDFQNSIEDYDIAKSTELFGKINYQLGQVGSSIDIMIFVITVCLLALSILIITMCVIFTSYNNKLVTIISEMNKNDGKVSKKDNIIKAAATLDEEITPMTKNMLFKGAKCSNKVIGKMSNKFYKDVETALDNYDKLVKGKESLDQSEESFGIIQGAAILIMVVSSLAFIKQSAYYVKHLKLKFQTFFNEQLEITKMNIESLIEKANDPSTPESEKERLLKVIDKQQKWCTTLAKWSGNSYKAQIDAATDAANEMTQDDKTDFEKMSKDQVEESENIQTVSNDSDIDTSVDNAPSQIIF